MSASLDVFQFDAFSTLVNSEVLITGATTLTSSAFGKLHICSGTTADYTVTLPAVSGNTGKIIGLRMSPALTKLVTIDGDGAETIDGANTRVMWAQEVAWLYCNGVTWTKIAGKSRPLEALMRRSSNQTGITNAFARNQIQLNSSVKDTFGAMVETGSYRIRIKRAGSYMLMAQARLELVNGSGTTDRIIAVAEKGGSQIAAFEACYVNLGGVPSAPLFLPCVDFAAEDLLTLAIYQGSNSNNQTVVGDGTIFYTFLGVKEIPVW
jgi:hypothetical protein